MSVKLSTPIHNRRENAMATSFDLIENVELSFLTKGSVCRANLFQISKKFHGVKQIYICIVRFYHLFSVFLIGILECLTLTLGQISFFATSSDFIALTSHHTCKILKLKCRETCDARIPVS